MGKHASSEAGITTRQNGDQHMIYSISIQFYNMIVKCYVFVIGLIDFCVHYVKLYQSILNFIELIYLMNYFVFFPTLVRPV